MDRAPPPGVAMAHMVLSKSCMICKNSKNEGVSAIDDCCFFDDDGFYGAGVQG